MSSSALCNCHDSLARAPFTKPSAATLDNIRRELTRQLAECEFWGEVERASEIETDLKWIGGYR